MSNESPVNLAPSAVNGPSGATRAEAIRYIEEDIRIHEQYAAWLEFDPAAGTQVEPVANSVGDVGHHREWIRRLGLVLACLKGDA